MIGDRGLKLEHISFYVRGRFVMATGVTANACNTGLAFCVTRGYGGGMAKTISFRPDEEDQAVLSRLTEQYGSTSAAIRRGLALAVPPVYGLLSLGRHIPV